MMTESLAQEIVEKLQAAREILLVLHRNPDPDSLGSAAALAAFLDAQAIPYRFYCQTSLPDTAQFFGIDSAHVLGHKDPRLSLGTSQGLALDVACTFDAGDRQHAGLDFSTPFIINFDHHATNTRFGQLNIVDTTCAATTEVIYRFFKAVRFPIRVKTAAHLLAGLLNDTDHFFNPATTPSSLIMASELLAAGVSLPFTQQLLFERHGIPALRLIGRILSRLKKHPRYDLAVTYVTQDDLDAHKIIFEDIEGVANILNAIGEAKAMLFVKAEQGLIRVSMRTTKEGVQLGRLAELCGGGGHQKAAGFRVRGALQKEGEGVRLV